MALRGSIEDVGMIDLFQLSGNGSRTGQLVLRSGDGQGTVFFEDGMMSHAAFNGHKDIQALVEMLDWIEGDFEFHRDRRADSPSTSIDIQWALMEAARLKDERSASSRRKPQEHDRIHGILTKIEEAFGGQELMEQLVVVRPGGETLAHFGDPAQRDLREILPSLCAFLGAYPREGLASMIMEDEHGAVVANRFLDGELILIAAFAEGAPAGMAKIGVKKLLDSVNAQTD